MSRLIPAMVLLLALGACMAPPPSASLRDPGTRMSSLVNWVPEYTIGLWRQQAQLMPPGQAVCTPRWLEVGQDANGRLRADGQLCLAGQARRLTGPLLQVGPGRFEIAGQVFWVLWADHDKRTMVLGDPAGRFALVLDKGQISPDRLEAARRILDFNGFDPRLLR